LTVGYGSTMTHPISFEMDNDVDTEFGFLKLFFTRSPANMYAMQQGGAYRNSSALDATIELPLEWGCLTVPVIQRAHGPPNLPTEAPDTEGWFSMRGFRDFISDTSW
jgi:hypothetical protein